MSFWKKIYGSVFNQTFLEFHHGCQHCCCRLNGLLHDDVIKWKHFPRYWCFMRGIHRPPVNSPHKGQWRGASMFSLICAWTKGWVNNRDVGDRIRHYAHYDVTILSYIPSQELIQRCQNHDLTWNLLLFIDVFLIFFAHSGLCKWTNF